MKSEPSPSSSRSGRPEQAQGREIVGSASAAVRGGGLPGRRGGERRSVSSGFVDARSLSPDQSVSGRIGDDGGTGVFVRPKVIDFQARVREKKRVGLRAVIVRVSLVAIAVILVCSLVWLLFLSPVLRLDPAQISVRGGNAWVSDEKVLSIARKEQGKSLLLVSTSRIESAVGGLAGVTRAEVRKSFPHGLEVTFKAEEPTAILKDSKKKLTAVDGDARVLNVVDGPVEGIPVIDVDQVDSGLSGKAVRQALKILRSMPEDMRRSVTKVAADTQDSVRTDLEGGKQVIIWGDGSQLQLKQAVVDKIIHDPKVIGDKHQVDVSAPTRPIIK